MKRALVPLAAGFEEIEAITVIDLLRRGGVDVTVAGVDGAAITGAHGITVACDGVADGIDAMAFDALILPGGMPGTRHLGESRLVREWVGEFAKAGRLLAAICAAPVVLDACGALAGRRATSHPAHATEMQTCRYETSAVVRDGNVITSRGAGTAVEFAAALVEELVGADMARDILASIQYGARPAAGTR
ncbi:MAG TPA: DJ-1 family glyoxalase III [Candidatus Krumholzibacteria bacterium]|nr:DJ-1 family glyoxalase III [Candidatus Krumholzibacteria bacterium]